MMKLKQQIEDYINGCCSKSILQQSLMKRVLDVLKGKVRITSPGSYYFIYDQMYYRWDQQKDMIPLYINHFGVEKEFYEACYDYVNYILSRFDKREQTYICIEWREKFTKTKTKKGEITYVERGFNMFISGSTKYFARYIKNTKEKKDIDAIIIKTFENINTECCNSTLPNKIISFFCNGISEKASLVLSELGHTDLFCWFSAYRDASCLLREKKDDKKAEIIDSNLNWLNETITPDSYYKKWKAVDRKIMSILLDKYANKKIQLTPYEISQNDDDDESFINPDVQQGRKQKWQEQDVEEVELESFYKEQHDALFWVPGFPFLGEELNADHALYLAYFYSWLRLCSEATQTNIAAELNIDNGAVTRLLFKNNHSKLIAKFPCKNINGILYDAIIFNIATIKDMGFLKRNVRCYRPMISDPQTGNPDQKNRKTILWDLYTITRNDKLFSSYEKNAFRTEDFTIQCGNKTDERKIAITCQILRGRNILGYPKKLKGHRVLCIKGIAGL